MSLKIGFILDNSADPDEMPPYAGVLPLALFSCLDIIYIDFIVTTRK